MFIKLHDKPETIFATVQEDSRASVYYFMMVILSCTVATYGLLSNSTAVVIGAMLIAPLMNPILGGAWAIASGNITLLKSAGRAEAMGGVLAVLLAACLTLIMPNPEITSEVLARTEPTILDLVIALASGVAGTYAMCVKPQGATMPGVAIATALMPPLCTVGIGLAKQDFTVLIGALLLFAANMIAINVAAIIVFWLAGFSKYKAADQDGNVMQSEFKGRFQYPIILLILVTIPLTYMMQRTYEKAGMDKMIKSHIAEMTKGLDPYSNVVNVDYREQDGKYMVNTAIRTTQRIIPDNIRQIENILEMKLGKPVGIIADVILVQKVDRKEKKDSFNELLPAVREKEIVEVVTTAAPEDVIEKVVTEKLTIADKVKLVDYAFSYQKGTGTYSVLLTLSGEKRPDDKLIGAIKSVLEERLKRRVEVIVQMK